MRVRTLAAAALALVALGPAVAVAQHPGDAAGEAEDEAFGDSDDGAADSSDADFDFPALPAAPTPTAASAAEPKAWTLSLVARSEAASWIERPTDPPLAKARQSLDLAFAYRQAAWRALISLHGEVDAAYLVDRQRYDDATIATYRQLFQLRETTIGASLGPVELTVGRQIIVQGEGDALSPLDVLNPRDLREPGQADLLDIRVPVLATRVGVFLGAHRLEATVVHESHFGFRPPPMGFYSPLPAFFDDVVATFGLDADALLRGRELRYRHLQPAFAAGQQQAMLRWVRRGEGLDLALMAGSVLDQQGVVRNLDLGALADPAWVRVDVPLDHLRYEVVGASFAWVAGPVLCKGEVGWMRRRPLPIAHTDVLPPRLDVARRDTLDAMVGLTYRGIANTVLAIEAARTTLLGDELDVLFPLDALIVVARAQHTLLRERLDLLAVASTLGTRAEYGWQGRLDASYLVRDGLRVGLGWHTLHPGREFGPFAGMNAHDRVTARLRWDLSR